MMAAAADQGLLHELLSYRDRLGRAQRYRAETERFLVESLKPSPAAPPAVHFPAALIGLTLLLCALAAWWLSSR